MKIILTLLLLVSLCACGSQYQSQGTQLSRAEQKTIRKNQEKLGYDIALQAIKDRKFVLEADKITFKRGQFVYVTSFTNFSMVNGDNATVQLAFNTMRSGPNGIGGITVDGNISNPEMKISNKGDVTLTFGIQGAAVSAQISLRLTRGDNQAEADVNPNFNSNRTTMSGVIIPLEESTVYKGRSI